MKIQTERLKLIPLTPNQLKLWIENIDELEKVLSCSYKAEPLEGFFLDVVKEQLVKTQKDSENYLWHSFLHLPIR